MKKQEHQREVHNKPAPNTRIDSESQDMLTEDEIQELRKQSTEARRYFRKILQKKNEAAKTLKAPTII